MNNIHSFKHIHIYTQASQIPSDCIHHHTVGVLGFLAEIESLKMRLIQVWDNNKIPSKHLQTGMDWDWTKKTETFPWGLSTAKNAQHIGTIGYFINITEKKKKKIHY